MNFKTKILELGKRDVATLTDPSYHINDVKNKGNVTQNTCYTCHETTIGYTCP